MSLYQLVSAALEANSLSISPHNSRVQKSLHHIAAQPRLISAVRTGVIADHRAITPMVSINPLAASIILGLEQKRGGKLSREKARSLTSCYQRIRYARLATEGLICFLKSHYNA